MKHQPRWLDLFRHNVPVSRRTALQAGGLALAATLPLTPSRALAEKSGKSGAGLKIAAIDRTTVRVPFREVPDRNMAREIPHWKWSEVFQVRLKSGHVGIGETLLYYTWQATTDADVRRAAARNAAAIMWDDTLGAGLQMALFDAVAQHAGVPVHALLGQKVNDRTPLAWWNIDTSVDDMVAECREAHRQGYVGYKTKGRPWFDVWRQIGAVAKALPKDFKLAIDFNDTLLDAKRGIPILKDLAKHPQVAIYETPIFQNDVPGNQAIRKATRVPVAMHYGIPDPLVAIREDVCDGFVIGGGASRVMRRGTVAAMADKPFWLQMVGTGITAAFSLHFGAVHSHATWPAVNCHQLFKHTLLAEPIAVKDGFSSVPDKPGLGFDLDPDAIARYRVPKPAKRPNPPRLIETRWPDGRKLYISNTDEINFMLNFARQAGMPYFERGVTTALLPDDGTPKWRDLYAKARVKPVMMKP